MQRSGFSEILSCAFVKKKKEEKRKKKPCTIFCTIAIQSFEVNNFHVMFSEFTKAVCGAFDTKTGKTRMDVNQRVSTRATDLAFYCAQNPRRRNRDLTQTRTATPNVGRQERCSFVIKHIFNLVFLCFCFCWNSVDSSASSWTKRWTLVLEMSATFWRQRRNGAVEVSFESRAVQIQIFTCAFSLVWLVLLFCRRCRRRPQLFCVRSLITWERGHPWDIGEEGVGAGGGRLGSV